MDKNNNLDLAVKLFKQRKEELKVENIMAKKWEDALQKKTPLFTKGIRL